MGWREAARRLVTPTPQASQPPPATTAADPAPLRTVTAFDAWALADAQLATLREVLGDAGIEAAVLPAGAAEVRVVAISAPDAEDAVAALAADARTRDWAAAPLSRLRTGDLGRLPDLPLSPRPAGLLLLDRVAAPGGRVLNDAGCGVELQFWTVTGTGTRRPDGGNYLPGTRLAPRPNRAASYAEPQQWAAAAASPGGWLDDLPAALYRLEEPVDLVYTWVDGSDPAWRARRSSYSGETDLPDATDQARYADHDELRYSLRSAEAYAGWARRIWLVTDAQVPAWLRTDHPRLTVVDHRELFADPGVLPVFNSHAIETQLWRIDGLAERFLYVNDDVFFGRPVRPELFFHPNGIVKVFPAGGAVLDPGPATDRDISVVTAHKRVRDLLRRDFAHSSWCRFQHTPLPQVTSLLRELSQRYPEEFARTAAARFRSPDDIAVPSALAPHYAYLTGRAVIGELSYGYLSTSAASTPDKLADWLESRRFDVFCLNDTELDDPAARAARDELVAGFLQAYFPLPSSFERA